MHLRKMVNIFYKNHLEKPIAISASLDSTSPMAKSTIKLPVKQKQKRPKKYAMKCAMWGDKESSKLV